MRELVPDMTVNATALVDVVYIVWLHLLVAQIPKFFQE